MEDLSKAYSDYAANPTPERLNSVLDGLTGTINASLATHGAADDPTIRTKARVLAVKAVKTYDPSSGAGLHTWAARNLQELGRYKRKVQGMGASDRTQLAAWSIHKGEQELSDKLGRSPDLVELADHMGLPLKKVAGLRAMNRRGVGTDATALEGGNIHTDDRLDEAARYLLPELDHASRKILEHRSGFGGAPIKGVVELSQELKMSPASVTKKGAYIAARLREISDMLAQ